MNSASRAFIFDLNGTMINDMNFHLEAWSQILNDDLKAGLSNEAVKKEMYGKNDELVIRIFGEGHFSQQRMNEISRKKEELYQSAYRPHLALLPGLAQFLQSAAAQKVPMAIGSAAIMFNIDFVLDNLDIRHFFSSIVSADDVRISKPDPETFEKAAFQMGVKPENCIVFEDAPKGVEAAQHAGMRTVVLTTMHESGEFDSHTGIIRFVPDYTSLTPDMLLNS